MARPRKQTVDYFPHDTDASDRRTLKILQAKYGNDGYAFWFKLLQQLGKSDGLFIRLNTYEDWEFLSAETHQKGTDTIREMLNLLAKLDAIDKELWEQAQIIWSQKFVNGVEDAFDRTVGGVPETPEIGVCVENTVNMYAETPENTTEMPQTKLKEIKRKEKEKKKESPQEGVRDEAAEEIWRKALDELKEKMSAPNFKTWLEKTVGLSYRDGEFVVGVETAFNADYLDKNQRSLVEAAVQNHTSPGVKVKFKVIKASKPP